MPNIKGIDLSDGIEILSGTITNSNAKYSLADLEAYLVSHSIAQTENNANNFLNAHFPTEQIKVHIFSASPLSYTCIVANRDVVIPPVWWE